MCNRCTEIKKSVIDRNRWVQIQFKAAEKTKSALLKSFFINIKMRYSTIFSSEKIIPLKSWNLKTTLANL